MNAEDRFKTFRSTDFYPGMTINFHKFLSDLPISIAIKPQRSFPIKCALFILFFSILSFPSFSQQGGFSQQDLSNIDVESLSDQQIQSFIDRAEARGISEQEAIRMAQQRGMPSSEVNKLRNRIRQIRQGQPGEGQTGFQDRSRTAPPSQQQGDLFGTMKMDSATYVKNQLQQKIFGFEIFNNQQLTFEPNLNIPTPENYQLGTGDEIIIDIWGDSEQTYQLTISPEGTIQVSNLSPLYLSGATIEEASRRIKNWLSRIYSGLRENNTGTVQTYAQISLGSIRSIQVNIMGEVQRPGSYTLNAFSTVFNALYASGGPTINGSFRNIKVIRNNETISTFDIYDFLINGDQTNNIRLREQDIIKVNPYKSRVQIKGEVKRAGIYEINENTTLEDVLDYAGGFTDSAYTHMIKVERNTSRQQRMLDISQSDFESFKPMGGDTYIVNDILDRFENRVQISGAVYREGSFELQDGMTVQELIEKAEGVQGDAFLKRATIYRTQDDFSTQVIPFNLSEVLNGETEPVELQREDHVRIPSIYDLREEYYVKIQGEVQNPGTYPFMEGMNIEDLIVRAGGLQAAASNAHLEVARRVKQDIQSPEDISSQIAEVFTMSIDENLELDAQDEQFNLRPFDQVFVRRAPGYQVQKTVEIEGEVLYPGEYTLQSKDERISDLIKRAGGLTPEAYAKGATLSRRTEFYEKPTSEEERMATLEELEQRKISPNTSLTEAEEKRRQRLKKLTREQEQKQQNQQNQRRRQQQNQQDTLQQQRLQSIQQQDTLVDQQQLTRKRENIGISLDEILQDPGSEYDLIFQEGDVLSIPKELQTVRLKGEFLYPITVRYDERRSFRQYVAQAGGFSEQAKPTRAYVIYANGSVDKTDNFLFFKNYPEIRPGATIVVPSKPQRRRLSPQELLSLSSGIATLGLIIVRLTDNL